MDSEQISEFDVVDKSKTEIHPSDGKFHTLVPATIKETVSDIYEKVSTAEYNITQARRIVQGVLNGKFAKPEDLKGKFFPGTDKSSVLLSDLADSNHVFTPAEINQLEAELIHPLMEIFKIREKDEIENNIKPIENDRSLENYGIEWLLTNLESIFEPEITT